MPRLRKPRDLRTGRGRNDIVFLRTRDFEPLLFGAKYRPSGIGVALTALPYGSAITWNPADKSANITLSGGNLTATSAVAACLVRATGVVPSGISVVEHTIGVSTGATLGIATAGASTASFPGGDANGYGYESDTGNLMFNNAAFLTGGATLAQNDVVGVVCNNATGEAWFFKNGALQYKLTHALGASVFAAGGADSASVAVFTSNFGASAFSTSYSV